MAESCRSLSLPSWLWRILLITWLTMASQLLAYLLFLCGWAPELFPDAGLLIFGLSGVLSSTGMVKLELFQG